MHVVTTHWRKVLRVMKTFKVTSIESGDKATCIIGVVLGREGRCLQAKGVGVMMMVPSCSPASIHAEIARMLIPHEVVEIKGLWRLFK